MNSMLLENISEAIKSIKSHALRAILTMVIVAIGIMALVGVLTALESIQGSITSSFMQMGSNTFTIVNRSKIIVGNNNGRRVRYTPVSFDEANDFRKRFDFPGTLSLNAWATGAATIKFESKKTNPNISVMGIDNNYFQTAGLNLSKGRNFTAYEMKSGGYNVIIGDAVKTKLFGVKGIALGKIVSIGAMRYRVIGVLESKGSGMGGGGSDRRAYISLASLRNKYYYPSMSFTISFMTTNQQLLNQAVDEAEGVFRMTRGLKVGEENNFSISRSDNIAEQLIENLGFVRIVAGIIAFITLLGASIGLMNIMLVSVSERTREIGLRKALGANNKAIRNQFLVESVVITELGGFLGIILGIILGNVVAYFTDGPFVIPWLWIIFAFTVSLLVGLLSGLFPAIKASKLDPIESLRFE
ncbi:MAG: ABC transporter permease [Bacteroidetes bacterium]|nr:MAG: ABC transporter permease [Bacteroidota bacterium]